MGRPVKSTYIPENKEKYIGEYPIIARSSWERDFMKVCDHNESVLKWASEPRNFGNGRRGIPYKDPLTGKQKIYIPDFLIERVAKSTGMKQTLLIEVKPMKEADAGFANTSKDAAIMARNQAKWRAAQAWCARHGATFITMTEAELFRGYENAKPRKNPVRPYVEAQVKKEKPKGFSKPRKFSTPKSTSKALKALNNRRKAIKSVRKVRKVGRAKKA